MIVNFPTTIWQQERSIMTIGTFNANTAYVKIVCNTAPMVGLTAKYVKPSAGELQVDLSDLVRIIAAGNVTVSEHSADDTQIGSAITKTWTRSGNIGFANIIAPPNEIGAHFRLRVFPPSMMLKPFDDINISFEISNENSASFERGEIQELPSQDYYSFSRENILDTGTDLVEFYENQEYRGKIELKPLDPCKRYAMVQWVSFSGITRCHTFEVINCKTETEDTISLQQVYNHYKELKGRMDGFVLRLEDLDRYDYWYYADLITSSQVRVIVQGTTEWRLVQVTTKAVEIPNTDAGKLNTLEIKVNYAKYDTL